MKINYWFPILVALIALLAVAGCLQASPAPQTPPASSAPDAGATAQDTHAADSPSVDSNVPPGDSIISSDPVSGQSEEVDLRWQELCMSSEYQVQIAKDPNFTIIVLDTGAFAPASSDSPGAYVPAGGRTAAPSSLNLMGNLEAGHIYYWRARVRVAASGQHMLSPWSEVSSFTVKPGTPVTSTSYGIQSIYPNNGQVGCPVKAASFSWSPMTDTTAYTFVLAKDAAMSQVIVQANTDTTAYTYQGQLEYGQAYYWRVMALEPVPGDWSATFSFQTEPSPQSFAPAPPQTPAWAWAIIVVGLILLIVVIVLIFRMRRR